MIVFGGWQPPIADRSEGFFEDFPYVDLKESQRIFFEFIDKWGFTSSQFEKMAFSNGMKIADLNG